MDTVLDGQQVLYSVPVYSSHPLLVISCFHSLCPEYIQTHILKSIGIVILCARAWPGIEQNTPSGRVCEVKLAWLPIGGRGVTMPARSG